MTLYRMPRVVMILALVVFVAATALAQAALIHLITAGSHAGIDGWDGRHALRPVSLLFVSTLPLAALAVLPALSPPGS